MLRTLVSIFLNRSHTLFFTTVFTITFFLFALFEFMATAGTAELLHWHEPIETLLLFATLLFLSLFFTLSRVVYQKKVAQSTGWWGSLVAIIAIGCASCGTTVLGVLLGALGISGVLLTLPFEGRGLQLLGLLLLALICFFILRQLAAPETCAIDHT